MIRFTSGQVDCAPGFRATVAFDALLVEYRLNEIFKPDNCLCAPQRSLRHIGLATRCDPGRMSRYSQMNSPERWSDISVLAPRTRRPKANFSDQQLCPAMKSPLASNKDKQTNFTGRAVTYEATCLCRKIQSRSSSDYTKMGNSFYNHVEIAKKLLIE